MELFLFRNLRESDELEAEDINGEYGYQS